MARQAFGTNPGPSSGSRSNPNPNINTVTILPKTGPVAMTGPVATAYGVANTAKNLYDTLPPGAKQIAQEQAKRVFDNVKTKTKIRSGNGNNGGESTKSLKFSDSPGYSLSSAPTPIRTQLKTPVKANTFVNDYMLPVEGACSPLHMTACQFQFPTATAAALNSFFQRVISYDIQTKAQANVSFAIDVTNTLTAAKIQTAFNNLTFAFQVYYFFNSIMSYHSDPRNKNDGMIYLRQQITAAMQENFSILERRLADTPIPPNLNSFLRYLMGNYYSGDTQGSPLIKILPYSTASTTIVDGTMLTTALTNLNTQDNVAIFTLMRRAIPQWTPKVLYSVEPTPVYDPQFKTIFANLPANTYTTTTVPFNTVANNTTAFAYNTFTESLDGAAFALTGAYSTADSIWTPGLMSPQGISDFGACSRISYYSVSGVVKFYEYHGQTFIRSARQETYIAVGSSVHLFGADKCQNVSGDSVRQSASNTIEYLMSLDTIRVDARRFLQDETGGRRK